MDNIKKVMKRYNGENAPIPGQPLNAQDDTGWIPVLDFLNSKYLCSSQNADINAKLTKHRIRQDKVVKN